MWAVLVVFDAEPVELGLQLEDRGGGGLLGEPAFLGLMEAFDLALSLRVVRFAVLLFHSEHGQEVFEGVTAAAVSGGVNPAVVGQGRGGNPVFLSGGEECGDDVVPGDGGVDGAGE